MRLTKYQGSDHDPNQTEIPGGISVRKPCTVKKGHSRIVGAVVVSGAIFAATTMLGSSPAFAATWTNTQCAHLSSDPGGAEMCISQEVGNFQYLRGQLMAGSDSIYNDGFFQYPVPATPIYYCGWATTAANTTSTCYYEVPASGRNVQLVDNYDEGQSQYQAHTDPITS